MFSLTRSCHPAPASAVVSLPSALPPQLKPLAVAAPVGLRGRWRRRDALQVQRLRARQAGAIAAHKTNEAGVLVCPLRVRVPARSRLRACWGGGRIPSAPFPSPPLQSPITSPSSPPTSLGLRQLPPPPPPPRRRRGWWTTRHRGGVAAAAAAAAASPQRCPRAYPPHTSVAVRLSTSAHAPQWQAQPPHSDSSTGLTSDRGGTRAAVSITLARHAASSTGGAAAAPTARRIAADDCAMVMSRGARLADYRLIGGRSRSTATRRAGQRGSSGGRRGGGAGANGRHAADGGEEVLASRQRGDAQALGGALLEARGGGGAPRGGRRAQSGAPPQRYRRPSAAPTVGGRRQRRRL
ncbi:hypothetical protein I4F81_003120 [Pyropia yezoensis]|uniref:Uncharacterized protein n=1 Tax=Pyropia yezoensis TaxID=2788 RepID=A0ACC3BS44_PYRYE|nr:hypothetical protein I4F81_003120 [Neopyropia yezoensis]